MSRVEPSLQPGGRRPFRACIGFNATGHILVSLYAVAGFAKPITHALRWELKQLALVLGKYQPAAKAVARVADVETSLDYSLDRLAVEALCLKYGWLRRPLFEVTS